ncbi:hypothetical protein [Pseudoalteromonas piscicida]|uniref:hypothetical protein n=1 Tax=Pseudoalteromonas piscicida TaxID=43662 RepID=UPI001556D136|nr:hypothetical protein [Pseudoalteromonas piscicida]
MRLQEGLLLTLAILARSSVSFASVEHVVYLDEDSYVEHSINDVFSAASRRLLPTSNR